MNPKILKNLALAFTASFLFSCSTNHNVVKSGLATKLSSLAALEKKGVSNTVAQQQALKQTSVVLAPVQYDKSDKTISCNPNPGQSKPAKLAHHAKTKDIAILKNKTSVLLSALPARQSHTMQKADVSSNIPGLLGFIFGVLGLVLTFVVPLLGLLFAIAGLVLSIIGLGKDEGKGFAIAGLVCSIVALLVWVIVILIVAALVI